MGGCKDISKHTWIWGYEDVRMQGYEDAKMEARAYEPEDSSMQGSEDTSKCTQTQGCEDERI